MRTEKCRPLAHASAMMALAVAMVAPPAMGQVVPPPTAPAWQENANRTYYDSVLRLAWRSDLGDRDTTLVGSANVVDDDIKKVVRIPVTGNDFFIINDGRGKAVYVSREGDPADRPRLVVNGSDIYQATRDTFLTTSGTSPKTTSVTLKSDQVILVAFDGYWPQAGDSAVLELTSTAQFKTHSVLVYRPDIRPIYPAIPFNSDPTVIAELTGVTLKPQANITKSGAIATAFIEGTKLTWLNETPRLAAGTEYYMTTVMKFHENWPGFTNEGGKLPGLANTGRTTNSGGGPLFIGGVDCSNAGWGGRPANGCRWSARTQWNRRNGDLVGMATYFYAVSPSSGYGIADPWPTPQRVERWFAYVQRVRVNDPGVANGQLSYWLCSESGCQPQYHRTDIQFRTHDLPEALINEAWLDVYCGGTNCGTKPWPRADVSFKRMTVTRRLPDLAALQAELASLNGVALHTMARQPARGARARGGN
jgi:hypothetical protein